MRKLLILLATVAIISGCASPDYQPGIAGVRDVPYARYDGVYPSRSGTVSDWSPSSFR